MLQNIWRHTELGAASPRIARKLVDTLYNQSSSLVIGASIFMMLGLIGFLGTGSFWYLGGLAFSFSMLLWRLWPCRVYSRNPGGATP